MDKIKSLINERIKSLEVEIEHSRILRLAIKGQRLSGGLSELQSLASDIATQQENEPCPECEQNKDDDMNFCANCGNILDDLHYEYCRMPSKATQPADETQRYIKRLEEKIVSLNEKANYLIRRGGTGKADEADAKPSYTPCSYTPCKHKWRRVRPQPTEQCVLCKILSTDCALYNICGKTITP